MKSYVTHNWPRLLAVLVIALVLGLGGLAPDPMLLGSAMAAPFLIGETLNADQVKELFEKQGKAWEEHKKAVDALIKAKAEGKAVSDIEAKLAKIGEDLDKLSDMKTHVDAAIAAMQRPGGGDDEQKGLEAEAKAFNLNLAAHRQAKGSPIGNLFDVEGYKQYKSAFQKMVRTGSLDSLNADERKAMIAGSDPDGGFLLPSPVMGRMVTKMFEQSIMRQIADVQMISAPALEGIIDNNEADANWVSEVGARTDTNTPQVGKYRIEAFEMYAAPKASQTLLDDAAVDIEGWLAGKVADKFGRVEGTAFWQGTGVGQPRGLATGYTLVTTGDATRAWGQFEKVKSGANGAFHTTQFDPIHDLIGAFKDWYLPNAQFVMRRAVRTAARKLKESTTNRYLWEPGLQAGSPERFMGYPVRVDEYMPTLATGSASLAFGDFKQAYTIVDRIGVRVLRDPYTSKPYVIFYSTKRTGGGAVNFEAVKFFTFES